MDPIIPQPETVLTPEPPKHFFNKKFAITFAILILLGAGAYASIWYWQKQQLAQEAVPTFTPRVDETAGWKTYTNTQYGFEFKYPENFKVSPTSIFGNQFKDSKIFINSPEMVSLSQGTTKASEGYVDDINISVYPTSQIGNLNSYAIGQAYRGGPGRIEIGGILGYKLITHGFGTYYTLMVEKNNQVYEILFGNSINAESLSAIENQILSTFKFIDSGSAQVYDNQYMTVMIPSGWTTTQAKQKVYINGDPTNSSYTLGPNPKAVNITKGNYILYINVQADHASGVQGGRFNEISMGAPSADAVITDYQNVPCGVSEIHPGGYADTLRGGADEPRTDYFVNSSNKQSWCVAPKNGSTVWYFSNIGDYFNEYKIAQTSGWSNYVITMAYNSKDVNSLPVKGSKDLDAMLNEMATIIKTLKIKGQ